MRKIKIGNKELGGKPYIIAEAGVNHNGSLDRAFLLIEQAAKAGADAIKFQTYTADELVVKGTPKFWEWEGDKDKETQYDAYKALEGFDKLWYPDLMEVCEKNGIEFLSTPFSFEAADYLNGIGMKAFKVASSDMSTLPYLEHIARFGKPILLSTGASTMDEIREAVETIKMAGNDQIVVMHCTLCYPTKPEDLNLNIIKTLREEFPDLVIGISDHSLAADTSGYAVACGAEVLEKHFTVDNKLGESADHWLSLNPDTMKRYVKNASVGKQILGSGDKKVFDSEKETRIYDKRSIVTKVAMKRGEVLTLDKLTYKRPGTGIWPKHYKELIGMTVVEDLPADTILQWTNVQKI